MTPDQKEALAKARESAVRLKRFADKARSLGLTVLEQWLREASVGCQAGADFQERAFKDNLISQTGKVVIDREPRFDSNVYGPGGESPPNEKACDKCGSISRPCDCEIEAMADAMKRKGLV